MEEQQTRRRQKRVRYEANVYIRGPKQDRAVVARAQNLSTEGMAVTGDRLPRPGEVVECRLLLGGRRTKLKGRVAWLNPERTPAPDQHAGAGIHFLSVEREDHALLSRLVEDASDAPEAVEVWMPGLEQPLRMRALIGTDEVKLGMRLPRLAVGMPVRIAFTHRGVAENRRGHVTAVRFLPGEGDTLARIAVQVATPRPKDSAGTISVEVQGGGYEVLASEEVDSQSMLIDMAALSSVQPATGAPQTAAGARVENGAVAGETFADRTEVSPPPAAEKTQVVPLRGLQVLVNRARALFARRYWRRWAIGGGAGVLLLLAAVLLLGQPADPPLVVPVPPAPTRVAPPPPPMQIEPLPQREPAAAAAPLPARSKVKRKRRPVP